MKKLSLILTAALLSATVLSGCATTPPSVSGSPESTPPSESVSPDHPEVSPGASGSGKYGNISGNIQSGGFVAQGGGQVFYVKNGAVYAKPANDAAAEAKLLYKGTGEPGTMRTNGYVPAIRYLNFWKGRLYFVADTGKKEAYTGSGMGEDYVYERVYSVAADGSDLREETAEKATGGCLSNSVVGGAAADISYKAGYINMQIVGDYIYYITSTETEPAAVYTAVGPADVGAATVTVSYSTPMQLRRVKIGQTGEVNEEVLVEDMGNSPAFFCVEDETIYYMEKWINPYYSPYDFITVRSMSLDGGHDVLLMGGEMPLADIVYGSDRSNLTLYIAGLQAQDGRLYFSVRESQGDFRDSWLNYRDAVGGGDALTQMLTEGGMVKSIIDTDGTLYHIDAERDEEGALTQAKVFAFITLEGGHSLDRELTALNLPEYAYTLNSALNVCQSSVFVKSWSAEGGETLFSVAIDGSDRADY